MEMSELDDAMQEHMAYLVFVQHRTFSYLDFLSFKVNDMEYSMSHGTFRNKISKLIATDKAELVCNSGLGFYSLKGIQVQKKKLMTPNHMGVSASPNHRHPFFRLIEELPLDKNALHDIRLRFEVKGIWDLFSLRPRFQLLIHPDNKDIDLPIWKIEDLLIRAIIHKTDTVTVIVGCSFNPIAIDINGIIQLSNALTRGEERLSKLLDGCGGITERGGCDIGDGLLLPEHKDWIVTMWHFGADASIEYTGKKFSITWELGENALIRAYSKKMKNDKTRIRLERQEYPRKTLADAIEEKLYSNGGGGSGYY
jgi:hypothetical protein